MLSLLTAVALAAPCLSVEGDIRTADGALDWFVVADGQVAATSEAPALPAGIDRASCERVDTERALVTPGLVAVETQLGLVEVNAVSATRQMDAGGDSPYRSSYRAVDSYNPVSSLVPVARVGGVTDAVVFPDGGFVSGQAGWVHLTGNTQADSVLEPSVAMVVHRGAHVAQAMRDLRTLFADARTYRGNRAAFDRGQSNQLAAHPRDLAALFPVLAGELPLVVNLDRAADIEAFLRFAEEQDIRLVITGGAEAWRHAAALAEAQVPVVVDPTVFGPGGFDQLEGRPDNAKLLAAAGVPVVVGGVGAHSARLLWHQAGIAVGQGLPEQAALAGLTTRPADAFGIQAGRIEPGAPANFVVWRSAVPDLPTGLFELTTAPIAVYIDGEAQAMDTRQTALRDRYLRLPGTPVPLPLPEEE